MSSNQRSRAPLRVSQPTAVQRKESIAERLRNWISDNPLKAVTWLFALLLLPLAPLLGLNLLIEKQTQVCGWLWPSLGRVAGCPEQIVRSPTERPDKTLEELKATRKAIEDKLEKIAVVPSARSTPPPLHQAFQVTPVWFQPSDLTVSLRKVATDSGGSLRLFACSRSSSRMSFVGEMAYAASQDSKSFPALFSEPFAVLLMQVEPSRGTPTSIIAPWDLKTQTRLKEPVSRPGLLNCNDIIGKF